MNDKIFVLLDYDGNIARNTSRGSGRLAVFTDVKTLRTHAWRYIGNGKDKREYSIAELEVSEIFELLEVEE
jgi:hypothetical protein